MTTVGEHALPFETLPMDADPATARMEGVRFCVLVDHEGPVALMTEPGGSAPPAIVVPAWLTLAELAGSSAPLLLEAWPELEGMVAVDHEGDVVGVVPVEVLDDYLGAGHYLPPPTVMGPGGHPGDVHVPGDPRLPRARIRCRACGFVNTLTFFDRDKPPECRNGEMGPHVLEVRC